MSVTQSLNRARKTLAGPRRRWLLPAGLLRVHRRTRSAHIRSPDELRAALGIRSQAEIVREVAVAARDSAERASQADVLVVCQTADPGVPKGRVGAERVVGLGKHDRPLPGAGVEVA